MIKKEWQKLLHNKILLVVLIAILAIPTIYTTLFLGSMWDPYGRLDHLPVAVVNEDRQAAYENGQLNIGEELVESLKENNALKFDFVDAATAKEGMQEGKYYMLITIPEDFSRNASTLLDQKPQKMELKYETNPGRNYIAAKMSESALEKIKNTVATEVTRTYAQLMFNQVADVGKGMQQAADGSGKLENGVRQLSDGNRTLTDSLQLLSDSTLTFQQGSEALQIGLKQYADGVGQVNDGAEELARGVGTMSSTVGDGAGQLVDGSGRLKKGFSDYAEGVAEAAVGADQLDGRSDELKSGVSQVSDGLGSLEEGSKELLNGLEGMSAQIGGKLPNQDAVDALTGGIQSYQEGIATIQSKMEVLNVEKISTAETALEENLKSAEALAGVWSQIEEKLTEEQKATLTDVIATMEESMGSLSENVKKAGEAANTISTGGNDGGDIFAALCGLKTEIASMNDHSESVLGGSQAAINTLYSGLGTVKANLDQKLVPGMGQAVNGITAAKQGVDGQLAAGVDAYTLGVTQVDVGLQTLNENSKALADGAESLDGGIGQLAAGLQEGVGKLQDGTDKLAGGTQELVSNTPSLLSGSSQLKDGAGQIGGGAGQLADGSTTLGSGLTDVLKGSNALNASLSDGAAQVETVSANDDTLNMFSDPVQAEETRITEVENNGHAMAAYMMSVGLWVACIAFCLMYPLTQYSGKLKSGFAWWLSKATVVYPIALAMALAMVSMLHVIDGFNPAEWGKTIAVACIAAVSFMSIMYFFNVWLGKAGSFLMLIFTVVQLAGSAGTYPIELSGAFVARIHKWLPFSYTVDAFRATIAGGRGITDTVLVLAGITVIFTVLTVWMFQFRAARTKKGRHNLYDYIEKSGLA